MPDQVLKLHWSPRSPFVRKVLIAAHEAGLADRLSLVRTVVSSIKANTALLTENPLGKLPTLTLEDGSSVYDSPVIVEYFALLAPDRGLLPVGGPDRLTTLRQQALGDGLLDLMLLWLDERNRPEERRSAPLLATNATKFQAIIARLGSEVPELRRRPFDIGHISIGVGLAYVGFRFPDLAWRDGQPALAAWLSEFLARPSVLAVPVIDDLSAPMAPPPMQAPG